MLRVKLFVVLCCVVPAFAFAQTYNPIVFTGFSEDVIAEGTGTSTLAVTTREMDFMVPSNYVICTKQFAAANGLPAVYGIPDNGTITTTSRTYQMTGMGSGTGTTNNAVFLHQGDVITLPFTTPAAYTSISLLGLATEGQATVDIVVNYADGTTQTYNGRTYDDWVGGANPILQGYGRIKRQNGPFTAGTYELAPNDPRLYPIDLNVSCQKVVNSVKVTNVSTGGGDSKRVYIFAISGAQSSAQTPVVPGDTLCANGSTLLSVQSPVATLYYQWFNAATGGTPFHTAPTYTTPVLTTTTTYYVQSINSSGCVSGRVPVTVTIAPAPSAPAATDVNVCAGQSATVSVNSPQAGITYNWFDAAAGGTAFYAGTSYTTTALSADSTFYIEAVNAGGCKSGTRTAVTVHVGGAFASPVVHDTSICSGQSVTLPVVNPDATLTYNWYSSSAATTLIYTGTAYTTPVLTVDTTFYIQSSNAGGCKSAVIPVNVTVLPALSNPVVPGVQICNSQTAVITVSSPVAGITYSWFSSSTGGTPLAAGTSYTTPVLTATTTYYVQASNAGGCVSGFEPVTVTVSPAVNTPVAAPATICYNSAATLTITNLQAGVTYQWFATSSGGTAIATGTSYTTPTLTADTTYYIQGSNASGCKSAMGSVTVTVSPQVAAPTASPATICTGQSATLSISSPQTGYTYTWYAVSTGGTPIATGTTFTTPNLTASTTYYAEAQSPQGCISGTRTPVPVTVVPSPANPIVAGAQICNNQTATLTVSNAAAGITYSWFSSSTGGTPIFTGTAFTTPALTSTTTYYVQASVSGGCVSTIVPVTVTVSPAITTPVAAPATICYNSTATLTVTNIQTGVTYQWFASSSGGTPIATGISYTTPTLTADATYYIQASNASGCKSAIGSVTATVAPQVAAPTASPATVCTGQAATLNINTPQAGYTYTWYTVTTGGTPVFTGTAFTTPTLTASTTYYLEAQSPQGCISGTRNPVTVTVAPSPANPVVAGVQICSNQTGTLTVSNAASGNTYSWFSSATGGTTIFTGTAFTSPALSSTTTYYVQATATGGCVSAIVPATVTVTANPNTPVVPPVTVCYSKAATVTITNVTGVTYNWYTSSTGGTPIATGSSFTTPALTADATYYVQASNSSGCKSAIVAATVTVLPQVAAPSVSSATVCTNQSASLSVNSPQSGYTYSWFTVPVNGTVAYTGTAYQTPSLTASTTYYVEAQSPQGCISAVRTPATVTILPALPAPVLIADTICSKQPASLSVANPQAGLTYTWYSSATGGNAITIDTTYNTSTLTASATYYVDATNAGGCSSARTPVTALVNTAPAASFTASYPQGCDPLNVRFTATSQGAAGYQWNFGDGGTSLNGSDAHIYHSGTYSVQLITSGNGCFDTLTKTNLVSVIPQPVADFTSLPGTGTEVQVSFANILFQNTSQYAQRYRWEFGDGETSTKTDPRHQYAHPGNYRVTLYAMNNYGCTDSTSKAFYNVIPDSSISIPNVFSPNHDGINDMWVIKGISGYTNSRMSIYNRWGALMYESFGTYKPWDGMYKGSPVATATYYYVLQLSPEGKPAAGWVMVVR